MLLTRFQRRQLGVGDVMAWTQKARFKAGA